MIRTREKVTLEVREERERLGVSVEGERTKRRRIGKGR